MTVTTLHAEKINSTSTFLPHGRQLLFPPTVATPRPILGIESLCVLGIPMKLILKYLDKYPETEDSFLADLSGNTYPGSIFLAFLFSILLHLDPYHLDMFKKPSAKGEDDGEDVLSHMIG